MRRPGYLAGFDNYGIAPRNGNDKEKLAPEEEEMVLEAKKAIIAEAAKLKVQQKVFSGFGLWRKSGVN